MGDIFKVVLQGDEKKLESLILSGVDMNALDKAKRTPLINAVIDNNLKVAEILLKHGADANAQDNQGWTALHFAAQNYSKEATRMLLANNCEVDVKDIHGNTPLFRAVFNSKGRGEVIQLLISHGADKTLKNNHGMSPSNLASTIANYNITQYM